MEDYLFLFVVQYFILGVGEGGGDKDTSCYGGGGGGGLCLVFGCRSGQEICLVVTPAFGPIGDPPPSLPPPLPLAQAHHILHGGGGGGVQTVSRVTGR